MVRESNASTKSRGFEEITNKILAAAVEVHKNLGPGFQEVTYQRALALELQANDVDFNREVKVPVYYKDQQIDTRRVDFVIEDCILEIKARKEFLPEDFIQTLNYLKASGYRIALLINFGGGAIQVKRFINTTTR